jgi:hypothetical protein
MASFLAARLKKLERQRFKPKVRRTVAEFDPVTGRNIGTAPPSRSIMRVPAWGSNEQWAQALLKQQHLLQKGIGK